MSDSSNSLTNNPGEGENPAANQNQPAAAPPEGASPLRTLADLFREEPSDEPRGDEPAGDAGESRQNAEPPKGLKDLAERLKLRPEDLYAIEIPLGGDGKTVKLSELKDAFAKQDDLTVRELEIEERRAAQEAEVTRAQAELQTLLGMLPESAVKPELREAIRKRAESQAKAEGALIRQHIPEWSDEKVRSAELAGMVEMMADYGFPSTYLQSTLSHRMVRFVRDAYLRKQRIEKALAQVQAVKRPPPPPKGKPNGAPAKPAAEAGSKLKTSRDRLLSILE